MSSLFRYVAPWAMLVTVAFAAPSPLAADRPGASTPAHGEMAGAIRSAGMPCAQVLGIESLDADRWRVECNSGDFVVARTADGELAVTKP
jgi:hypothetical protein